MTSQSSSGHPFAGVPLSGPSANRAAERRRDPAWLDAAFVSDAVRILLMREGLPLVEGSQGQQGPRPILWLGSQATIFARGAMRIFLGLDHRDAPLFALVVPTHFSLSASPIAGLGVFEDFRLAALGMDDFDAGAAVAARALHEWHARHEHCAKCGHASEVEEAGWKRRCPDCGAEHFPRVDPVAIMLVTHRDKNGGEKCLLGRQAAWRPGMWSCLAGFVEPGETFEQAAVRELFEEAGCRARPESVRYLFCQPWPFPSSLMIGLVLEAETDDIVVDPHELETARWFTREELAQIMAGQHLEVNAPSPVAVAHHIMKAWLDGR